MSEPTSRNHDHGRIEEAMHRVLDGDATLEEQQRVSAHIAADPDAARDFARMAMLHDALGHELGAAAAHAAAPMEGTARPAAPRLRVAVARWATAAVLGLSLLIAGLVLTHGPDSYALDEVARVVAAERAARGASYRIEARGEAPRTDRAKPSLDGATLHVGEAGRFVLERTDDRGAAVLSGSDGTLSWSIHGRGPVRISHDPQRFRGALPGQQHDLPFVDPLEGFSQLAAVYDLHVIEPPAEPTGSNWVGRTLVGTRKATVGRGPKRISIEYDPASASIVRMHFSQLPQQGGGPESVTLTRLPDGPRPAEYFLHQSHHEPGRRVVSEDKVPQP